MSASRTDASTRKRRLIKGALQDWDVNNLDVNPGGIWSDVTLLLSGPQ